MLVESMIVDGIGAERFHFEIIADADLAGQGRVADIVDRKMLPRAIGGTANSSQEQCPQLSAFLRGLGGGGMG